MIDSISLLEYAKSMFSLFNTSRVLMLCAEKLRSDAAQLHDEQMQLVDIAIESLMKTVHAGHVRTMRESSAYLVRTFLDRSSHSTIQVFLEAFYDETLPDTNRLSGLLFPIPPLQGSHSARESLIREMISLHHEVGDYDWFDLEEVLACVAGLRTLMPEGLPLEDETDRAQIVARIRLAYELRYSSALAVWGTANEKFGGTFQSIMVIDDAITDYAIQNPERIIGMSTIINERPEIDGETLIAILSCPSPVLGIGIL